MQVNGLISKRGMMNGQLKNVGSCLLLLVVILLCSCSSENITLFRYRYFPLIENADSNHKIFVAPLNTMVKINGISDASEQAVQQSIEDYLSANGYEVLPRQAFVDAWTNGIHQVGGLYDPMTGYFSREKFDRCLEVATRDLAGQYDFSFVLFPDLIIKSVKLNKFSDLGEWDGVKRQLPCMGVYKNGWRKAEAASIMMNVFTNENDLLFMSVGGLDFVQICILDGRNYKLVNKENPFDNRGHVAEGIGISLHPFVFFEDYPSI